MMNQSLVLVVIYSYLILCINITYQKNLIKSLSLLYPTPLIAKFDNWDNIPKDKWVNIDYLNIFNEKDNDILKSQLANRFIQKIDNKKYCFKGYAGNKYKEQHCPVCGGMLLCELSSLHIKYVKVKYNNTYVPIILCSNCTTAFNYANDIYLDIDNIDDIQSNTPINLCFDMQKATKSMPVNLTFLHRLLIYKIIIDNN